MMPPLADFIIGHCIKAQNAAWFRSAPMSAANATRAGRPIASKPTEFPGTGSLFGVCPGVHPIGPEMSAR